MTAHEDISDALDKLAAHGSPDQIAAHLAEQGHVGERIQSDRCPVANYVHAATQYRVSVGNQTWARVDEYGDEGTTPHAIGRFIGNFDTQKYPELIKAAES